MISKESLEKLNQALKEYGITQRSIARKAGLSQPTVNRFFAASQDVSNETIDLIVDAAGKLIKEMTEKKAATEKKIESITKIA